MEAEHESSSSLDVLRTIAVLMVLFRHLFGALGIDKIGLLDVQLMGIFGVLLFFFLTAHVLMFSLQRLAYTRPNPRELAGIFFARRAFRIYPLSICLVATGFVLSRLGDWGGFENLKPVDLIANLLLVQNVVGAPNIIGPLWSLPLELQMYLFLPTIFLLVHGHSTQRVMTMYVAALVVGIASFKLPAFASVGKFMPCFLPGAIAYVLAARRPKRFIPFWAMIGLVLAMWLFYEHIGRFSQTVGGWPVCLALGFLVPFTCPCRSALVEQISGKVAKYSYGIYLIHVPVLATAFRLPIPTALKVSIFFVVTYGVSLLAYRIIERPMIEFGSRITQSRAQHNCGPSH